MTEIEIQEAFDVLSLGTEEQRREKRYDSVIPRFQKTASVSITTSVQPQQDLDSDGDAQF